MSGPPLLDSLGLWKHYEGIFLELLRQALTELADCPPEENEDELNRRLYKAIGRASHRIAQDVEGLPGVLLTPRNPPAADDDERVEREYKEPDLIWPFIDSHAPDPEECSKHFVVECKRLTKPHSRFAREYVVSGISRFRQASHGYAKGMPSGAMIGYLQQIEVDNAHQRINSHSQSRSIPPLVITEREGESRAHFEHGFERPFAASPFRLFHIWARVSDS